ncbi:MAG TPA: GntR family transcriptional regulator [Hyphomicrobiaceae bacterium]
MRAKAATVVEPEIAVVPAGAEPIRRLSLHDQVATRVRDMIIEGGLEPGSRINEGALGASLGVSRTPLREALKTLAGEGLIDFVPARGAIVRKLTPEAVASTLEVMAALEALAGRLACARASDAGIAGVRRIHDRMLSLYARRKRLEYYKFNQAIHTEIVRLARNPELATVHGVMQARLKRIRFLGNSGPENWAAAVAEHEEMIVALEARNGDALAEILTRHMENSWARVKDVI